MFSSQNSNGDLIFALYNDARSVYRLNDVAMLMKETNFESLNKRLNYFVKCNKIQNPRKGVYTKTTYDKEELACRVFIPSYISLEYVLQKAGVIFQYNSQITSVSYLSRNIEVDQTNFVFRKIKGDILVDTNGIIRQTTGVNIATPERAFLDTLYLNGNFYFDNINSLDKELIFKLLSIYKSNKLTQRVTKLLSK
jgi:hypothetical protein